MKFSEHFGITRDAKDDWFDPLLFIDTGLFIDPFLIFADERGVFVGSHEEIIGYFATAFKSVAKSVGNPKSVHWRRAYGNLHLPEVEEICLGYTVAGTGGLGAGSELAKIMTRALWEAIQVGTESLEHFEEVGIIRAGIGPDRISDATANIIRHRLIAYTQSICKKYSVPMSRINYQRGKFDQSLNRWVPLREDLPINPETGKAVLLVPRYYLNDLPTINADSFWSYCYTHHAELLAAEFGAEISSKMPKTEIVDLAKKHKELRDQFITEIAKRPPDPYDLDSDPKGLYDWYVETQNYALKNPLSLVHGTQKQFEASVKAMILEFANFVENQKGWELLWNGPKKPRSEGAAQRLMMGTVVHYCRANNIDLSQEANIGRGPVDFKMSRGHVLRALIEVKLANNTKFWSGLRLQLPQYMKSEGIEKGYFLVVCYRDIDMNRIKDIEEITSEVSKELGYRIETVVVDARYSPPSASKL